MPEQGFRNLAGRLPESPGADHGGVGGQIAVGAVAGYLHGKGGHGLGGQLVRRHRPAGGLGQRLSELLFGLVYHF